MAVGLNPASASATGANAIVNGLVNLWIQLHTGDPGAAGTANVATETTRKQISLADASGGSATNNALIEWVSIAGSQDASHFSLWTASTAGTFEFSGEIIADPYTAGNTYAIAVGDLTVAVTTVATDPV